MIDFLLISSRNSGLSVEPLRMKYGFSFWRKFGPKYMAVIKELRLEIQPKLCQV